MPVEFEEVLPTQWTTLGDTGIQYYVSDVCLMYTKDDPYPLWDGTLHMRCGTLYGYAEIREEDWTLREARKIVWDHLYTFEQGLERRRAVLSQFARFNPGGLFG